MPGSNKTFRRPIHADNEELVPRRVRHITSIQVRNLTPFPARDEFASALSQPSERPQFGVHGHLSDDLDVTLGRKRGRRRSSTSLSNVITQGYLDLDTGVGDSVHSVESTPRKRTISRASTSTVMGTGLSPGSKGRPTSKGPFIARPGYRQRTISASSSNSLLPSSAPSAERLFPSSFRGFLRDTSQAGLEGIIGSRLVETFITMTSCTEVTSDNVSVRHTDLDGPALSDNNTSRSEYVKPPARRNTLALSGNMTPRASMSPNRDLSSSPGSRGTQFAGTSSERGRARSASVLTNRRGVSKPPHVKILSQKSPITRASPPLLSNSSIALSQSKLNPCPTTPDYLSPIHRPSTNPSFHVDARDGFDFAPGADLDCPRVRVEIWGRISQSLTASLQDKRKGKEKEKAGAQGDVKFDSDVQWSILERWDVNLNDLIPLPEDLASHPSRFPSNTLCITLDPPGQTFYLPAAHSSLTPTLRSRSPSPSGYNSDPETGGHQIKSPLPSILVGLAANDQSSTARLSRRKGETRSPSWQDLLRLVTLQAVIRDTEDSLTEVVHEIDTHVVNNTPSVLTRELSENEAWLNELQTETNAVRKESDVLRSRLRTKTDELRQRKGILIQAHTVHEQDLEDEEDTAIDIREEKQQLDLLRIRLPPIRNALFTTLAFIYPIELVSPPDLLFSILDVPLPIPNGPTEPAPPLSVPSHKDVTEEAVATALGYAAQTVHLLATYLGKNLMYPVTCIGSRSIIKDGISAMVGPRMFPLFSKGVDTYRFEYGVFLLNKNIEMLMTDRNLKALDTRHTLPNLKNLLLTLTDPDIADSEPRLHRAPSITSTTISALQSPIMAPLSIFVEADVDPAVLDSTDAETIREYPNEGGEELNSPPPSGSTTPTKTITDTSTPTNTVRKSRTFLDLTPLSGFFKSRSASNSRVDTKAQPPLEDARAEATPIANGSGHPQEDSNTDDEDDRRTIRAGVSEEDTAEGKSLATARPNGTLNGAAFGHAPPAVEKIADKLQSPQVTAA